MGEPNSTFSELLLKYFNSKIFKKNKKKIIIIGNKELFEKQSTILKYKIHLNEISNVNESSRKIVNIINVVSNDVVVFTYIRNKILNFYFFFLIK